MLRSKPLKFFDDRFVNITGDTMTGTLNTQALIPTKDNVYDLGSSTKRYANAYLRTVHSSLLTTADLSVSGVVDSHLEPAEVNLYNLGNSTLRWRYIWAENTISRFYGYSIRPVGDASYDLGSLTTRWRDLFLSRNIHVEGQIRVADDTYAGIVTTDADGIATITFTVHMGLTKPVVLLTPEFDPAIAKVFVQIIGWTQDADGNYTGVTIGTYNHRAVALANVPVHFMVIRKSAY